MSTVTVQLPESLMKSIEALALKEGYTVSQFLASAAGEKLAAVMTADYLRQEAQAGRRTDFDRYLAGVPDVTPDEHDRLDRSPSQPSATRLGSPPPRTMTAGRTGLETGDQRPETGVRTRLHHFCILH